MSLLRISRCLTLTCRPLGASAAACRSLHTSPAARGPASGETGGESESDFKKKESAHEREYATRQERQTLMDMLAKMERDADPGDVKAKKALELIFSSNGVKGSAKLVQDLLKWKHTTSK